MEGNVEGYAPEQFPQRFLLAVCECGAENALFGAGGSEPCATDVFGVNAYHLHVHLVYWFFWEHSMQMATTLTFWRGCWKRKPFASTVM